MREASEGKRVLAVVTRHWDVLLTPLNVKMSRLTNEFQNSVLPLASYHKKDNDEVNAALKNGPIPVLHRGAVVGLDGDNDAPELG